MPRPESAIPRALQRRCSARGMRLADLLRWLFLGLLIGQFCAPARAAESDESYELLPGSAQATPVYVRDSGHAGPTVLIVAAIHGDEVAGHHAAEALRRETPAHGRWIVVPTANRAAFAAGVRASYDLPDLNRQFPGAPHGAAGARLADALLGLVARYRPARVLDLHEAWHTRGGERNELANSLIVSTAPLDAGKTCRSATELVFGLLEGPPLPGGESLNFLAGAPAGSFNREASARFAVPVITVESDRDAPLKARIAYHRAVILRLLDAVGSPPR